jgi:hypothetical protein
MIIIIITYGDVDKTITVRLQFLPMIEMQTEYLPCKSFLYRDMSMSLSLICSIYILGVLQLSNYVTSDVIFKRVYYEFGSNLGNHVIDRVLGHLHELNISTKALDSLEDNPKDAKDVGTLILLLGNSTKSLTYMNIRSDKYESYRIVIDRYIHKGAYVIISNGRVLNDHIHKNLSFSRDTVHYGAVLGAYATLELLGFSFLHPLQAYIPRSLTLSNATTPQRRYETPHWPERGWHIHTQHPLEVNEVLQGFDIPHFGTHGHTCVVQDPKHRSKVDTTHTYCERWEDMLDDVNRLFEWTVANRLNKIEWLLLGHRLWGDELETRHYRLSIITSLAHDYSLMVGADCPLGNIQQHGWYMVNTRLPFQEQMKQIEARVDWIFNAGFDFLTTESGMSEFTHPECSLMLDMLNHYAQYVNHTWGREAGVKVHCSTGQTCHDFLDPRNGEPVNFNFLTMFAVPELGVFPHTVQAYGFGDNTAGSYGNDNFSAIEEYLVYESKLGNRSVIYYGETSYWVNVDIDVPLFLPIIPQRRLQDLRKIARREIEEGFHMHGQMNFDSGWEWAYWINDVITARASWNPLLEEADEWMAFNRALAPVVSIFGGVVGPKVADLLMSLAQAQETLLIKGEVQGVPSADIRKLSGFAYMSGVDTWVDVPRMFGVSMTQPDKVHLHEFAHTLWTHIHPLLAEMERVFGNISRQFDEVVVEYVELLGAGSSRMCDVEGVGICGKRSMSEEFLLEIQDCVRVLYLRARQTRLLYQSKDLETGAEDRLHLLVLSREVLTEAGMIVRRREDFYRVPLPRVTAWRENPTVYRYGYLWSVHALYYWWRDQGLAEEGNMHIDISPCYLNRMDVSEVAVGWGKYSLELLRSFINKYSPFSTSHPLEIVNCIAPPSKAYSFPADLVINK